MSRRQSLDRPGEKMPIKNTHKKTTNRKSKFVITLTESKSESVQHPILILKMHLRTFSSPLFSLLRSRCSFVLKINAGCAAAPKHLNFVNTSDTPTIRPLYSDKNQRNYESSSKSQITENYKWMQGAAIRSPLARHSIFNPSFITLERGKEKVSVTVLSRCKCASYNYSLYALFVHVWVLSGKKAADQKSPTLVCLCFVFARAISIMGE